MNDVIFKFSSTWADRTVLHLKIRWNKLWSEIIPYESEETENVSVEEIVHLCNGLSSEILSTKEVM
jgi:hypothetical protein